jgi:hypothetical protein
MNEKERAAASEHSLADAVNPSTVCLQSRGFWRINLMHSPDNVVAQKTCYQEASREGAYSKPRPQVAEHVVRRGLTVVPGVELVGPPMEVYELDVAPMSPEPTQFKASMLHHFEAKLSQRAVKKV